MATELPGDYYDQVNGSLTGLTGKRMHWIDVHSLQPIRKDLETRGIRHKQHMRRLSDRDLRDMGAKSERLMINLWIARGLDPEEPEVMSDDEDPDDWTHTSIVDYLNRLE